jgi:hypothetical protein
VGVVAEVAEFALQLVGFDAGQRVAAGGLDDGVDVPGVEIGFAVFEPLRGSGVMKARWAARSCRCSRAW